jgi:hypothetical protein
LIEERNCIHMSNIDQPLCKYIEIFCYGKKI